ncbi:hypothetical protein LTR28_010885, partial [Elasticomyces elasticus]
MSDETAVAATAKPPKPSRNMKRRAYKKTQRAVRIQSINDSSGQSLTYLQSSVASSVASTPAPPNGDDSVEATPKPASENGDSTVEPIEP